MSLCYSCNWNIDVQSFWWCWALLCLHLLAQQKYTELHLKQDIKISSNKILQLEQSLFGPLFLTSDWPKSPVVKIFLGLIFMDIFLHSHSLCHISNNVYIYQHCLKYKNYICICLCHKTSISIIYIFLI